MAALRKEDVIFGIVGILLPEESQGTRAATYRKQLRKLTLDLLGRIHERLVELGHERGKPYPSPAPAAPSLFAQAQAPKEESLPPPCPFCHGPRVKTPFGGEVCLRCQPDQSRRCRICGSPVHACTC